ncbi:MAG: S-methyl-5-thioribose-1-phosphate isomerase [Dehalococcoidales bacterium]|nr:S-methyl-5-thioribose-1-phosphate isomerase [Dehalococcoidales bacterium]
MKDSQPLTWLGSKLRLLDQTNLPREEVYLELAGYQEVAQAIREMKVRGAPAIGVAAAYGVALGALEIETSSRDEFMARLKSVLETIEATRPTARNLFMATGRMQKAAEAAGSVAEIKEALVREAVRLHSEEAEATRKLAQFGADFIKNGASVLTHCNTGSLATTGYGTALGVIKYAYEQGKKLRVFATETRPRLQGTRLTAWELRQAGIPFTLITDSMAGHFMNRGEVSCVIVGADRIAANGDTANKIGTYSLAVLAMEHGIPFYVAAPTTTIDPMTSSGEEITIEERSPDEVLNIQGVSIAPEGIKAANPAFDVTPHLYISAIITEKGVVREPYGERLGEIV